MPADLNNVTLIGRLTKDPELRHTGGGDPICTLRLAVSSRGRDEAGGWIDKPNYFNVTAFGRQAEAAQYLAKGHRCAISGRLTWREWQADDGTRRQEVGVAASEVQFLGAPSGHGDGGPNADAPAPRPAGVGDADISF